MAADTDLEWRAASVALLTQFDEVVTAWDVGAPGTTVRHDVDASTTGGKTVAVEVTRLLDEVAHETYRAFDQHGGRRKWTGSSSWTVFTSEIDVRVKRAIKALRVLLPEFEHRGIESLSTATWVVEPRGIVEDFDEARRLFERLEVLGISDVERRPDDDAGRHLRIHPPVTGGFAWSPTRVVELISDRAESKAEQLMAFDGAQRWVLMWTEPTLLQAQMALRSKDWGAVAPPVALPAGVDRAIVVVAKWGSAPHFLVRQFHRDVGWTSHRIEREPVIQGVQRALEEAH